MGGKGSGGLRVGSGRKPWKDVSSAVEGDESADAPSVTDLAGVVARPDLPKAVALVWDELAPLAEREGTLVPATAFEFAKLCRLAVRQAESEVAFEKEGFTEFGLKVQKAYASLTQRLEIKLKAFKLAPMGRAIVHPQQPKQKSAFERLKERRQGLHAVN